MPNTEPNQWHLSKSVPITLILAVFLQTIGAVWWAAALSEQVTSLRTTVKEVVTSNDNENLRQWGRINANESNVQLSLSLQQTTQAILERVEQGLQETRRDISKQNDLLRDLLTDKKQ